VVKALLATALIGLALAAGGCGSSSSAGADSTSKLIATGSTVEKEATGHQPHLIGPPPRVEPPKGIPPKKLKVTDLKKGSGAVARVGDEVTLQLVAIRYTTGYQIESSWSQGAPLTIRLDPESVSPGWVQGLPGMREGGRRRLVVPTKLTSRFPIAPGVGPEGTLIYVIDLLKVNSR